MKAPLIVFLSILTFSNELGAQGYTFDSTAKRLYGPPDVETYGFASTKLPRAFTLDEYAPPVMDQEEYGTCVGWASAYAAASISRNFQLGITDEMTKLFFSFDPYYFYSLNAVFDGDTCQGGLMVQTALANSMNYGFKHYFLPPAAECSQDLNVLKKGLPLSKSNVAVDIYDFTYLKYQRNITKNKYISELKTCLFQYKTPIIIGARCDSITEVTLMPDSMSKTVKGDMWVFDKKPTYYAGHAMCVMGYDDQKHGGAFKVMNSWGEDVGDKGYVWITYDDFYNHVDEVMCMIWPELSKDQECWMGDCENGYGIRILKDSSLYEGQFKNGIPDGYGIQKFKGNFGYAGGYVNGIKHGNAFILWDNEIFEVVFENGKIVEDAQLGFAGSVKSTDLINRQLQKQLKIGNFNDLPDDKQNKIKAFTN